MYKIYPKCINFIAHNEKKLTIYLYTYIHDHVCAYALHVE
jgi:Gpi18-like mannosyltransferase